MVGGLTTQLTKQVQSTAGTSTSTAFNIGVLEGIGNYQDVIVGPGKDFFKFKLERPTDVTVSLSGTFGSQTATTTAFAVKRETGLNPDGTPILQDVTAQLNQSLAAGNYFIEVTSTAAPGQPSTYNIRLEGDPNVINLRGTSLNVLPASAAFQGGADGAIRLADLTQQAPDAKASVDLEFTIQNTETSNSGPVNVRFYVSRDNTINADDLQLGDFQIANVVANGTVTQTFAGVELPPGDDNFWTTDTNYFFGYEIDPVTPQAPQGAVIETNEGDNIGSTSVAIENTQTPDLLGVGLFGSSTQISRNGQIGLTYTVRNQGKKSTGSVADPPLDIRVEFVIYRPESGAGPETFNPNDTVRATLVPVTNGDDAVLPLNIDGETTAPPQAVTLDLSQVSNAYWEGATIGQRYYIGMVIDPGQILAESDDSNNSNRGLNLDLVEVFLT